LKIFYFSKIFYVLNIVILDRQIKILDSFDRNGE